MTHQKGVSAMRGPFHRGPFVLAGLTAAATMWLALPAPAAGADYCVTCKSPSETYRCRVTGSGFEDLIELPEAGSVDSLPRLSRGKTGR